MNKSMNAEAENIDGPDLQFHQNPRYLMHERVGSGGMYSVFKATDRQEGRFVAMKVGTPSHRLIRYAQREAAILKRFNHSNIARVVDFFKNGEQMPFIVTEFIQGQTLEEFIRREEDNPQSLIPYLISGFHSLIQVSSALQHAHEKGVLHLDLKPANIMRQQIRSRFRSVLIDWSLSRKWPVTFKDGILRGTPGYFSPEHLGSFPYMTPKTDVYGLGGLLYAVLTGRHPNKGKTFPEEMRNTVAGEFVPVQDHNPRIPLLVANLCHSALSRDPSVRPTVRTFKTAAKLLLKKMLAGTLTA